MFNLEARLQDPWIWVETCIERVPFSGCWIWMRTTNGAGKYGRGGYGIGHPEGIRVYMHRWVYQITHGAIPDGMMVCHRCDIRCCINPDHLYLGDAMSNHIDKVVRGRARSPGAKGDANATRKYPGLTRGGNNGRAKLCLDDITAIRTAYTNGEQQRSIACRYGIGQSQISRICRGASWHEPR
jgi:hypothetical protein